LELLSEDSYFIWSDGTPLKSKDNSPYFTNWAQDEPNPMHRYAAVTFSRNELNVITGSQWKTAPCNGYLLLCEYNSNWEI